MFSCEIYEIFKNTFSNRAPLGTGSGRHTLFLSEVKKQNLLLLMTLSLAYDSFCYHADPINLSSGIIYFLRKRD